MLTTSILLAAFLVIGFFARNFSRRTRLLMISAIIIGIVLLARGKG
jgi:preprotein translocase subunit SecG